MNRWDKLSSEESEYVKEWLKRIELPVLWKLQKVDVLRLQAQQLGIKYTRSLNKEQLIKEIENAHERMFGNS